jgi:uncharacterized membrane protein
MAEQPTTQNNNNGLAIAALALGIVSVPIFFIWFISFIAGVLAIIFGAISLKSSGRSMALAGLITGCVGASLSVLFVLILILASLASYSY